MKKTRLWRVVITHVSGYQAPSFKVETSTFWKKPREIAEMEAIKVAKEKSGLGRFPKSWTFTVIHLEDYFYLETSNWSKWVKQGVYYQLENGAWARRPGS